MCQKSDFRDKTCQLLQQEPSGIQLMDLIDSFTKQFGEDPRKKVRTFGMSSYHEFLISDFMRGHVRRELQPNGTARFRYIGPPVNELRKEEIVSSDNKSPAELKEAIKADFRDKTCQLLQPEPKGILFMDLIDLYTKQFGEDPRKKVRTFGMFSYHEFLISDFMRGHVRRELQRNGAVCFRYIGSPAETAKAEFRDKVADLLMNKEQGEKEKDGQNNVESGLAEQQKMEEKKMEEQQMKKMVEEQIKKMVEEQKKMEEKRAEGFKKMMEEQNKMAEEQKKKIEEKKKIELMKKLEEAAKKHQQEMKERKKMEEQKKKEEEMKKMEELMEMKLVEAAQKHLQEMEEQKMTKDIVNNNDKETSAHLSEIPLLTDVEPEDPVDWSIVGRAAAVESSSEHKEEEDVESEENWELVDVVVTTVNKNVRLSA